MADHDSPSNRDAREAERLGGSVDRHGSSRGDRGASKALLRIASRLAREAPIDWDEEMRNAGTHEEREAIGKLRIVAAMSIVNRSLLAGADREANAEADGASDRGRPPRHVRERKREAYGKTECEADERADRTAQKAASRRTERENISASILRAQTLLGRVARLPADRKRGSLSILPPDSRWGTLQILEYVGGGSFGDVHRALDTTLGREVALKIIPAFVRDLRGEGEVVREARLLARVRHPNVVTVYGADRIDDRIGIWTEFLRGQTLDRLIQERGVLDASSATRIGIDLCRALAAVHAAGIVHQDVKLTNVMQVEGGRVVLMDFGLGRESDEGWQRRRTRAITGTPLFMAPEVLAGSASDARSDLYSLGVVLFALVTAAVPFEAATIAELRQMHASGEPRNVHDLRPDLPDALNAAIGRLLAFDPGQRYQTAGEAERALYAVLERAEEQLRASTDNERLAHTDNEPWASTDERLASHLPHHLRLADRVRSTTVGESGLRTAIDASWHTLSDWERSAFAQCAVFEGGFSLEAAEAVIDLTAFPEAPWIVDVLQSLVDKSLLRSWVPTPETPESRPAVRFAMLPSVHEFARWMSSTRSSTEQLGGTGFAAGPVGDERAEPPAGSFADAHAESSSTSGQFNRTGAFRVRPSTPTNALTTHSAAQRHAQWFARAGKNEPAPDDTRQSSSPSTGESHQQQAPTGDVDPSLRSRTGSYADLENIAAAARRSAAWGDGETAVCCFRVAWSLLDRNSPSAWAIELGRDLLQFPLEPEHRVVISSLLDTITDSEGRS